MIKNTQRFKDFPARITTAVMLSLLWILVLWMGIKAIYGFAILAALVMGYEILSVQRHAMQANRDLDPLKQYLIGLFAILYVLGGCYCFTSLFKISFLLGNGMLLNVISCDIGAYMAGRLIGGKKLAPHISPGKTWSGFLGGVVIAALLTSVVGGYVGDLSFKTLFVGGTCVAALSQGGDLLESAFKRYYGVKDMGSLLPGHGGLCDRLDGIIMASYASFILVSLYYL